MKILRLFATPFFWVARLALALGFLIACFVGAVLALVLACVFFASGFDELGAKWTNKFERYANH